MYSDVGASLCLVLADSGPMSYLLAFHIIAVVCWFAGLFYLPRLFVYHADTPNIEVQAQFQIMEYKLYHYIMLPAMLLTLLTGMGLLILYVFAMPVNLGWLWLKLFLVLLLVLYHFYCGYCVRAFKEGRNMHSARFYRIFNEVPAVLLIVIVMLAVVKPF
jgi:protoporphyrinogen IX oxidase